MASNNELCIGSTDIRIIPGATNQVFRFPLTIATWYWGVLTPDTACPISPDPPCDYYALGGINETSSNACGNHGEVSVTDASFVVTPSIVGTPPSGLTVTWSAVDDGGVWVLQAVVNATLDVPNGTYSNWSVRLKMNALGGSGYTSQQLIITPSVVVEGVYDKAALFTFPHQGGGFYISSTDICTNETEVDASLSLSKMYRVFMVCRLTDAAANNVAGWSSDRAYLKLVAGLNEVWKQGVVVAYNPDWYAAYGDPFGENPPTPYDKLRMVVDHLLPNGQPDYANPSELFSFQCSSGVLNPDYTYNCNIGYPPSSAYQNTGTNFTRLGGHVVYTVGVGSTTERTYDVVDRPKVNPYVRSVVSTDGTSGGVPQTVGEGYFERLVGNSVTLYPAVANDNRVLSATDMLSMEVATSASGPWYAFGAPQVTGYTYSLNDPSIVFNYDDGTDAFDYTAARLIFTPTAAGNYYLRVKPTADANPNVRSTQTIRIQAISTPVTSIVFGAVPSSTLDSFFVNVSTSCSAGKYQLAIVNPSGTYDPSPSGDHDDLELFIDGVSRSSLSSPGTYYPADPSNGFESTAAGHVIQVKVPSYLLGKLYNQSFGGIISLKATVGGQTFYSSSSYPSLVYTRPGATLDINGAGNNTTLTPCPPLVAPFTFTRTVRWENLAADTLIELSSPLAASNGVITYNPSSFTPTAPNLVSGSQVVTCTYTHPDPVVSVIVDTTIVATATPLVGDPFTSVGTLKIFPCAAAPGVPSLTYYKPATDRGLVFESALYDDLGVISRRVYNNTSPLTLYSDSASEIETTQSSFFKIVTDGSPDAVNGYTIEASTSPAFSSVVTLTVPSTASAPVWSNSATVATGMTLFAQRNAYTRGTYLPNEIAISLTVSGSHVLTNPFPVYYIRTKITGQTTYSNTVTVTAIAYPYMASYSAGLNNFSTNLYLEAGSGFLVCPSTSATVTSGSFTYYASSGSPLFTIQGSAGLLQSSKTSIFAATPPSRPYNTRDSMWGVVDAAASGDYTLNILYGAVAISSVTCKVVATNHVNLRIGGSVDGSSSVIGTQVAPTYNAVAVPGSKTFVVVDGSGAAVTTVVGTLQFTPSLSNTSPVYAAILFNQPDPIAGSDPNGKTSVAAKTALTTASGCSLVEATSPSRVNVVPLIEGQSYPPYINTNGLRFPRTFNVGGTELTVSDCNFGLVKGIGSGGAELALNIPGNSKQIGYPNTSPQYARMEIVQFSASEFRLKTLFNGPLSTGSTGITSIVMELKFTLGSAGCLSVTKTIPVTAEQCVDGAVTVVDLDAAGKSIYSCDMYPRLAPSSGGGVGYDTGLTNPTIQYVYDYAYPLPASEYDATHIPKYGLELIGSVLGTAGSPSGLLPVKFSGSGTSLDIVLVTNGGSPSCTKKILSAEYIHSTVSAWLPKPTRFFVGATSTSPLLQVQNLYDNDVLWIQLQNTIDPLIGAKLGSDYRLVFTNIATGVSLTPKTIGSNYYVSGDGAGFTQPNCIKFIPLPSDGFVVGATYAVSVVHASTSCAYTAYSVGSTTGTITYQGQKVAAAVTIPALTLYPCFTSVLVTATGTGLSTIKKFSIFEVTNTNTAIPGWDKLSTGTATGTTIPFTIPANGAFPTTRTASQSKTFKVQFYTADDIALLPPTGLATLTMNLVPPQFEIVQSFMETSPIIGTIVGGYHNVFTVRSVGSTCCSSCSSGNCVPDPLTSTDPNSTVVWTSSLPAWLADTTPVGALPNTYTISNSAPIPGSSGSVQVTARVKYYGSDRIVTASYTLTPTSAFAVSTATLPPTTNGTQNYSAFIGTVNKPCSTLQWTITNRSISGATRSLPSAVTIAVDAGNANRAKITWPVVSDPGAVFPATYKFRVRAQCVGGAQIAEGDVQLVVTPSTPIITSVTPVVGYFDVVNDTVTLTGTSFSSAAAVKFDNLLASDVVVNPAGTSITCTPPVVPDSGGPDVLMSISVENGDGGVYVFPQKYTYTRKLTPVLLGVSPSSGTPLGGTKVLLTGANFEPSSVVTIDGIEQPIVAITPSSILFITFPHSVGDVEVVVSNSNCDDVQVECPSIQYTFRVSPQITAVYPYSTSATGQDPVFIVGTGFYETELARPRVLVDNFEIPASLIRLVAGVG